MFNLVKESTEWFRGEEAKKRFNSLNSLDEKTIFIYSYLKTISDDSLEKENILFKFSFWLIDGVGKSNYLNLEKYEKLISPIFNPFIAFVINHKKYQGAFYADSEAFYAIIMAIIHNMVNVKDEYEWIYDNDFLADRNKYANWLAEKGNEFIRLQKHIPINPSSYLIEENLRIMVLELYWLFGNKGE